MPRLTFRMGDAFPADDPIASWVMNLSIALGDLRIAAKYATRSEQPAHERIYFVKVFASYLREIAKLLVLDCQKRADVREFVARLPEEAKEARAEVERALEIAHVLRSDVTLLEDIKRVRDDTFHYVSDPDSDRRLQAAMSAVADMEGVYNLEGNELRADFADLVAVNRMHPFGDSPEHELAFTHEMHDAIIALNEHVATFMAQAEAGYLLQRLPKGIVQRDG
jgi:hypothetical protein